MYMFVITMSVYNILPLLHVLFMYIIHITSQWSHHSLPPHVSPYTHRHMTHTYLSPPRLLPLLSGFTTSSLVIIFSYTHHPSSTSSPHPSSPHLISVHADPSPPLPVSSTHLPPSHLLATDSSPPSAPSLPSAPSSPSPSSSPLSASSSSPPPPAPLLSLEGVCNIAYLNPCVSEASCSLSVPLVGQVICTCPTGYYGDGAMPSKGGNGCNNIDECTTGMNNCNVMSQICIDTLGSYECKCRDGYILAPDNKTCIDVDECHNPLLNRCDDSLTDCVNTAGGYKCACRDHRQILDESVRTCRYINECEDLDGVMNPCQHTCTKAHRTSNDTSRDIDSVVCGCWDGYRLGEDGKSCVDIDECITGNHTCDNEGVISVCNNTDGGYTCMCQEEAGYIQTPGDPLSCSNFNECEAYPYICGGPDSCCRDLAPPRKFACMMAIEPRQQQQYEQTMVVEGMGRGSTGESINTVEQAMVNAQLMGISADELVGGMGYSSIPSTGDTHNILNYNNHYVDDADSVDDIIKQTISSSDHPLRYLQYVTQPSYYQSYFTQQQPQQYQQHPQQYQQHPQQYQQHPQQYQQHPQQYQQHPQHQQLHQASYMYPSFPYIPTPSYHHTMPHTNILYNRLRSVGPSTGGKLGGVIPNVGRLAGSGGGGILSGVGGGVGGGVVGGGLIESIGGGGVLLRGGKEDVTCPVGFRSGGSLYRSKIKGNAKKSLVSAISAARASQADSNITADEVVDGLVSNANLITNEATKWYSNIASLPQELYQVATGGGNGGYASTTGGGAAGGGGVKVSEGMGKVLKPESVVADIGAASLAETLAMSLGSSLITSGIKKVKFGGGPAESMFLDRTGKSKKIAFGLEDFA
eukprot:GHVQ01040619.1.p1 GENE.GHVQ01040619.1~~GHVQ01040619.1.p1  ORF type:complete len:862 (+),score=209.63 GHVQ01040619.1:262-2847(+)